MICGNCGLVQTARIHIANRYDQEFGPACKQCGRRDLEKQKTVKLSFTERLNKLGFDTYVEYLDSSHWQKVRGRYRKSKRPQACVNCGCGEYQLHHKTYERLGKERLADLMPLCGSCHKDFHDYLRSHPELRLKDTDIILEAIRRTG